ncbi:phosphatidate cytidylyltransferase [Alkalihalobacillus alcalophilus ATCC 27647 = CGMCC 1.3604]|uniref:Phosphatidate cytidylyltransferase n=1 Tax=Alkalihalobacillus alcalophilus ATCC 27647 = CGMCC 1.3604 TaxID=1218173 RepID=A0A4S4K1A8_ALKAL|nr:phosphatidate cytidylyltransferase [Alkalihalobacillus alcalophilus]MED1562158.1 phosphatidate cytidylyltransferase [Alkalihalobacillus alcalophilus]THG91383.1 phosphatidate cytidylyltransferase [Alkalihalobacillus alcalophilus ATCC 27647 = CGMCC 1.3604]
MKQRIITGVIGGALFISLVIAGGWLFSTFIFIVASVAMTELLKMKKISPFSVMGLISLGSMWLLLIPSTWFDTVVTIQFTKIETFVFLILFLLMLTVLSKNKFTFDEVGFVVLSSVYVGFGFHYLLMTREIADIGMWLVFFVLIIIWTTDSGAYFIGRAFGKHKLWPDISPKKTVEGAIGGIISAVVLGTIFYWFFPIFDHYFIALFVMLVASTFGQLGDLVESALKRHYSVKDSGTVLPGHGGILDRFDSLIYVMPILHLLQLI